MAWGAGPAAAATIRAKDAHERGFGWGNHPSERKGAARRLNRPLSGIRNTPGEVNYPRLSAPRPSFPAGEFFRGAKAGAEPLLATVRPSMRVSIEDRVHGSIRQAWRPPYRRLSQSDLFQPQWSFAKGRPQREDVRLGAFLTHDCPVPATLVGTGGRAPRPPTGAVSHSPKLSSNRATWGLRASRVTVRRSAWRH